MTGSRRKQAPGSAGGIIIDRLVKFKLPIHRNFSLRRSLTDHLPSVFAGILGCGRYV